MRDRQSSGRLLFVADAAGAADLLLTFVSVSGSVDNDIGLSVSTPSLDDSSRI